MPSPTEQTNTPPAQQPEQRRRFRQPRGSSIAHVYFLDDQNAWAVGSAGSIYNTTDNGKTWKRQLGEQQRNNFREVLFYDDMTGWIASSDGTLLETQDGGNTWEKLAIRTNQRLIGIHFASLRSKMGVDNAQ